METGEILHKIDDKVDQKLEFYLKLLKVYKNYFDKLTKKKTPPLEGLFADEDEEEEEEEENKNQIKQHYDIEKTPVHVRYFVRLNHIKHFTAGGYKYG